MTTTTNVQDDAWQAVLIAVMQDQDVLAYVADQKYIHAIKHVREAHALGLREARDMVYYLFPSLLPGDTYISVVISTPVHHPF